MRGADSGPWRSICALPALWTGLLYDRASLKAAWDLVGDWSQDERDYLRAETPKHGLATTFRGEKLSALALAVLELARSGLRRRARLDSTGQDESHFLNPLLDAAHTGKTPAERLLDDYATRWRGSVDPIYVEGAY